MSATKPQTERFDSPFMQPQPVKLGFGIMVMLLITVVFAGLGLLILLAMRVPAITSEFNAWLGRTGTNADPASGRQAQVIFATFLYTVPLGLGIFVYGLHHLVNWIDRRARDRRAEEDDEQFRM